MSAVTGEAEGGDAQLTLALDSFDQLTLRRDRQKRRVTEEENAVRGLEDLLKDKQRQAELLAREAEARAAQLASLERRVPALEETCRGARRSLLMLTQMRDLLKQQLDAEKRKTEDMLKTLDAQLEAAAARWSQYEAVYLTMPAFQQKVERDALAAEERTLEEQKQRLESERRSRVSDRDFCVRLAEYWTQARLLEGAIASATGERSPDGENMSGACSQGFGTPRASITPSPVNDMETDADPEGGATQSEAPGGVTVDDSAPRDERNGSWSPDGREQRQPTAVSEGQDAPAQMPAGHWTRPGPGWDGGAAPTTPQKRPSTQIPLREIPPPQTPFQDKGGPQAPFQDRGGPQTPFQDRGGPQAPPQSRPSPQIPFQHGPSPQQDRSYTQTRYQDRGGPQTPLQNTEALQAQIPIRQAPQAPVQARPAPQTVPSPAEPRWSPAQPHEPAPSPRCPPSFLIQMPILFRPTRPSAVGAADSSPGPWCAAPAQPGPSGRPAGVSAPAPPGDVEMTDMQEVATSAPQPATVPPSQPSPDYSLSTGGSPRGGDTEGSPMRPDARAPLGDGFAGRPSPGGRELAAAAVERQIQSNAAGQRAPPVSNASPAPATGGQGAPPPPEAADSTLTGRQYWLPMSPETPRTPAPAPADRHNFVQRLRQSPELQRQPSPARPPAAARSAAAPLETGLAHQFLRPALPQPCASPQRRPTSAAAGDAPTGTSFQRSIFDTPGRPALESGSPQRPPVGPRAQVRPAAPCTPCPPAPPAGPEPATPARAAAGDTLRSAAAIFASPEADGGQLDASFSLFGGRMGRQASPQPPAQSSMSLFGAGDVGGDGDQGADDFSFSFFGGGARGGDKEPAGGGVLSFF